MGTIRKNKKQETKKKQTTFKNNNLKNKTKYSQNKIANKTKIKLKQKTFTKTLNIKTLMCGFHCERSRPLTDSV